MTPSPEQQAVIDLCTSLVLAGSRESVIVDATAGSGKTTTAVQTMHSIATADPTKKIIYMAFGKRNERDMTRKIQNFEWPAGPPTVTTQHAHGRRIWSMRTDLMRSRRILEKLDSKIGGKPWHYGLSRLVEVAQSEAVMCRDENGKTFWPTWEEWESLAYGADIDAMFPVRRKTPETWKMIDRWMRDILHAHAQFDGTCTYGDMVWLPLVHEEMRQDIPKYHLVITDEYQDTNRSRRILSNLSAADDGVRLWIGDRRQAIMGFAGADRKAFASVERSQNCPVTHLPMTVSFRVTKSCAREVAKIVPDFKAHENAPEGTPQKRITFEQAWQLLQPGDVIIARNNRPLIDVFFRLMHAGINARLEGPEFGKKLQASQERILKREGISRLSVADFRAAVAAEGAKKFHEYLEEGRKWKAAKVRDEYTSWLRVIDFAIRTPQEMMESLFKPGPFAKKHDFTKRTIETVDLVIRYILKVSESDSDDARETMITCSTGHKSKGLEFNNVFWYAFDTLHPSKFATTPEELEQEENLMFVIRTRSRGDRYLIPEISNEPEPGFDDDEEDKLEPPAEEDFDEEA